jgi:hypothetical protein
VPLVTCPISNIRYECDRQVFGSDEGGEDGDPSRPAFDAPAHVDQVTYAGIEEFITADDMRYAEEELGLGRNSGASLRLRAPDDGRPHEACRSTSATPCACRPSDGSWDPPGATAPTC